MVVDADLSEASAICRQVAASVAEDYFEAIAFSMPVTMYRLHIRQFRVGAYWLWSIDAFSRSFASLDAPAIDRNRQTGVNDHPARDATPSVSSCPASAEYADLLRTAPHNEIADRDLHRLAARRSG